MTSKREGEPFDLMKMWEEFKERVEEAPLLTEAELQRQAYELLVKHVSMLDAVLCDAEKSARDDLAGGEPVAQHLHQIRQELDEFGILEFKLNGLQRGVRTRRSLQ